MWKLEASSAYTLRQKNVIWTFLTRLLNFFVGKPYQTQIVIQIREFLYVWKHVWRGSLSIYFVIVRTWLIKFISALFSVVYILAQSRTPDPLVKFCVISLSVSASLVTMDYSDQFLMQIYRSDQSVTWSSTFVITTQ